ncbi:MAG TPA: phosphatidylserine decarboxylase family protein [Nitrospiria bacterium]|nr:phosphatidylserine decarboxylase family protein [Nitrospiria bacterium]
MRKTESPVKRERLPFLVGAVVITAAIALLNISGLTLGAAVLAAGIFWFFRDPERIIPEGDHLVVSPADGKVLSVTEVDEDRFLKDRAKKISIFLNIFDVHVNRIPASGRIREITYQPGTFLAADKDLASKHNEQNAVFLETGSGRKMVFIQVAGLVARRIVCWVREGQEVSRGERFGMIRFGSRTDIFLPLDTEIRVSPGDRVKGGSSIIGAFK